MRANDFEPCTALKTVDLNLSRYVSVNLLKMSSSKRGLCDAICDWPVTKAVVRTKSAQFCRRNWNLFFIVLFVWASAVLVVTPLIIYTDTIGKDNQIGADFFVLKPIFANKNFAKNFSTSSFFDEQRKIVVVRFNARSRCQMLSWAPPQGQRKMSA